MIHSAVNRLFGQAKAFVAPARRWLARAGDDHHAPQEPSPAVVWAWDELKKHNRAVKHAVDAGCGRGRNSLFLARKGVEVTALDFTPSAINALKLAAHAARLDDKVRALVYDVTEGWPVQQHGIDFVVDAFCFKHITGNAIRLAYKQNIIQALDVRGTFLIAFDSVGDGYYGRYITEHCGDGSALCLDPATNLQSVLFTRDHVVNFFAPEFRLLAESTGAEKPRAGGGVSRAPRALLFERNPKSQGGGYSSVKPEDALMKPRYFGQFKSDDR